MPDDGRAIAEFRLDRRDSQRQRPVVAMPVISVRQNMQ